MSVPLITSQPEDQTAAAGTTVLLHVGASGADSYQWTRVLDLNHLAVNLVNGTSYAGAQTATLTLPDFGPPQVGLYGCVVTGYDGVTATRLAVVLLSGMVMPSILAPPDDLTVAFGGTATFTIKVKGEAGPFTYKWYKNGEPLADGVGPVSGAFGDTLSISGVTTFTADWYTVRIANASGAVMSAGAGLSVQSGGQTVRPQGSRPTESVVALFPPPGGVQLGGNGPISGGGIPGTGLGGEGAGSGPASFAIMGGNLGNFGVYDGNYTVAQPCGLPMPSFPFLDQGSTNAVVFRIPMEQTLGSYAPLSMTVPIPGATNLYSFGDANFQDLGAGIVRFDRMCGNIPARRVRRGLSINYAFQFILTQGASITVGETAGSIESYTGPTYSVGSRVYPVDMIEVYDYFLDGQQAGFPLRRAPSVEMIGQEVTPKGEDFNAAGTFPLTASSTGLIVAVGGVTQILAEDDKYSEYRGKVLCRVRRLIDAPTLANFRNSGS